MKRYIEIEIDISDERYIYLHRRLKKFLDEMVPWYAVKSWRFVKDGI